MKQKNGFIATSLIYSFFLVFLSILLATLNGYLINDRILSTYNKSVKEKLDLKASIPNVYAIGASCIVEPNEQIFDKCFYTFNMVNNPIYDDDYVCFYTDTGTKVYSFSSTGDYNVTCIVRNKEVDDRYLYSASTTVKVVTQIGAAS